jgi:hypothetical protein
VRTCYIDSMHLCCLLFEPISHTCLPSSHLTTFAPIFHTCVRILHTCAHLYFTPVSPIFHNCFTPGRTHISHLCAHVHFVQGLYADHLILALEVHHSILQASNTHCKFIVSQVCSAYKFITPSLSCVHSQLASIAPSVVHFTVDAVNRHLTVRRNLRF